MDNKNNNKTSFREAWNYTRRGIGIIHKLIPSYIAISVLSSIINSIQPLSVLYLSALILNELSGMRNVRLIVIYVVIITVTAFIFTALRSVILRKLTIIRSTYHSKILFLNSEYYMKFDFEHIEKSLLNDLVADIEANYNSHGLGIPRLFWTIPNIMQRFFGMMISLILLAGMFTTVTSYEKSFITSHYAIVILCILITLTIVFTFKLRQKEQTVMKKVLERNPKTNSFFQYYYNYVQVHEAAKDIRIYNQKPIITKITKSWSDMSLWHSYFHFEGVLGGITAAGNVFIGSSVYLLIGLRALAGMYGIGSVVQYVGAVTNLIDNLTAFINECAGLKANSVYLAQLYKYLDQPDLTCKGSLTTEKRTDNDYEIEFHNVSFKYPNSDVYALKNLSLKFRVGQRLAVVGMNGSGKTTMIKLLCRLYDPSEGEITLNGINIKKYDYLEYMNLFSVVFQDFKLFSYSLGQNVAVSTDIDVFRTENCLEKAGFAERVKELPQGIGTYLYKQFDENGVEISVGEAQKIALARALYKDAPIIVLDEPTAALDPIAEYDVYSRFNDIIGNKTAIYISHRLSSCRFCDDIAVFHEGSLIQRGSHERLLADAGGKYSELWNAQAKYYI